MFKSKNFKFVLLVCLIVITIGSLVASSGPAPAPTTAPTTSAPKPTTAPTAAPTTAAPKPTTAPTGAGSQYTAANPYTVSIVAWDLPYIQMQHAVRAVLPIAEKNSGGRLKFKIVGGVEVVPGQEQFEAARAGVIDSVWGPTGYWQGTAPAGTAMFLDPYTAKERRAIGLEAAFNAYYESKGLHFLMMLDPSNYAGGTYGIFLNKPITKPEDMKGMKFRATGTFQPMFKAFGGIVTNIPSEEIYTAVQNNVVQGCHQPAEQAFFERALYEVLKYYVEPFFGKVPTNWSINLNKWKNMPPDLQKILMDAIIEVENGPFQKVMYDGHTGWEAKFDAKGMKVCDLGPEGGKRLVDAFADGIWAQIMKDDPKTGAILKEYFPGGAKALKK